MELFEHRESAANDALAADNTHYILVENKHH